LNLEHRKPSEETGAPAMSAAITLSRLSRTFAGHRALDDVSLTINPGERVALIGPSGSGKSTLLRLIAGLLPADRGSGEIVIHGRAIQRDGRILPEARAIRARVGFVFQQFNLVGRLPVLTNVLIGRLAHLPLWRTLPRAFSLADRRAAMAALARVGLADFAARRTGMLSGGQQQRTAIARALCQQANIILADEPIASLDPESSALVMDLLTAIARTEHATLLVSLHQLDVAIRSCERVIALRNGRICFDGPSSALNGDLLYSIYGGRWAEVLRRAEPSTPPVPSLVLPLP
jgi:phosphonate transport system ATP-binding protein